MSDPTDATLLPLLAVFVVIGLFFVGRAAGKALRGHFADRRRFPGQMDERLEGLAKVAQGDDQRATETRENGPNGECVGSRGRGVH